MSLSVRRVTVGCRHARQQGVSNPYGRPYRRRKAASFYSGIPCSICGLAILTRAEFTLHHDPPVADGGNVWNEHPAHVACNASHGGKLGAARSGRRHDAEATYPAAPPPSRSPGAYQRVHEGAVAIPLRGPVEVVKADGVVVRVRGGRRYLP
jgi:hypothetical protein